MTSLSRALRVPTLHLALLLLAPSAAFAAIWNVSPAGTGNGSLATANSNAQPGDVILLAPGTYSATVNPARNGSAAARITYIGSLANPASVVVAGGTLNRRYVTVKGVRFNGDYSLDRVDASQYAQYDSLAWCEVADDFGVNGAKDNVVYRVDVTGGTGHFTMAVPSVPVAAFTIPERNTIRRCVMHLGLQQTYGTHVVMFKGMQRCVLDSNQFYITMAPNITAETDPLIAFYMKWCEFKDNRWRVHSLHNADHLFRWRDSTMFNRITRDTMIFTGYNVRFAPSSSGSWAGTTDQNTIEGLYLKKSCVNSDVALFYQNGSRRDTLRNCVVIDSIGKAFQCLSIEDGTTLVDHCTFVGSSRWGVVEFPCGIGTFGNAWPSSGRMVFTNNLVFAIRQGGSGSDAAIGWQFSSSTNDLTSDRNLYYIPAQNRDRAIRYVINSGGATFSAPGTGQPFYNAFGEDANSLWADPLLANASFTSFDGELLPGSPAIGAGTGGSDIGALGVSGPDVTPPAAVADLAFAMVNDLNVVLSWTAPGDNGNSGTATTYDLRYATFPITAANFASATAVVPQPVPAFAGTAQSYVLGGLTRSTTYYAALRTLDDAGNWSAISNVPVATTAATDQTPPKAVDDLNASP